MGYDIAVIGAGSAGFSAAITAANLGATVALIGYGTIGGTCVNVGCVPSKAMLRAVEITQAAKRGFDGVEAYARVADWAALVAQKQALVEVLRGAKYEAVLPSYPAVEYIEGRAAFQADGSLLVDGTVIEASKVIIATGSRQSVPDIAGLHTVGWLDSTSALHLPALPDSLMIMGGGYIGVEIAQIFARAGSKVTIVTRNGLLPEAEPEVSAALTEAYKAEGITVLSGLAYETLSKKEGEVTLHARKHGKALTVKAAGLMLATGRQPNAESLKLSAAGINIDAQGGIIVDAKMQTSRAGIYAVGDVTGKDQFVYMAAYGAKLAAQHAMGVCDVPNYDNSIMPSVVFSDPQVASVGLTQAAAEGQGLEVVTSVLGLEHVPRALAARDTRGLIKLVAEKGSKKLLGAHIIAPEGADSIQTAAMALKMGMTYEELGAMIFPYLTTVEGLKLAAQTFEKDVAKLSCCAG